MKDILNLRVGAVCFLALFALGAPAASAGPAKADFCRKDMSEQLGCGFATLEACQASASGRGGICGPNPFANPAASAASSYAYAGPAKRAKH